MDIATSLGLLGGFAVVIGLILIDGGNFGALEAAARARGTAPNSFRRIIGDAFSKI